MSRDAERRLARERKRRQRARERAVLVTGRILAQALGAALIETARLHRAGRVGDGAEAVLATAERLALATLAAQGYSREAARRVLAVLARRNSVPRGSVSD